MRHSLRRPFEELYGRILESELTDVPAHVAVIQDGNRRYADLRGVEKTAGHRAGAQTTEELLNWCEELGIEEVTLYAFSTENFERPETEREALFDLITEKLRDFAEAEEVHEKGVRIRAIGELERLPARVRDAVDYAERQTRGYSNLRLNVALAYGGRAELLGAARDIARRVEAGDIVPEEIDTETVADALSEGPTRSVDLIIRSGGDERTSNFLPWQANGNEAAVYFTTPYWPEFRRIDFLRAIRTYSNRDESWGVTRVKRARAVISVCVGAITTAVDRFRSGTDPEEEGDRPAESPN